MGLRVLFFSKSLKEAIDNSSVRRDSVQMLRNIQNRSV